MTENENLPPAKADENRPPTAAPSQPSQPSSDAAPASGTGVSNAGEPAPPAPESGGAGPSAQSGSGGDAGPAGQSAEPHAKRRRRRRKKNPAAGAEDVLADSPVRGEAVTSATEGQKPSQSRRGRGQRKRGPARDGPGGRDRGRQERRDDRHHALAAVQSLSQMAQDLLEIEGVEQLARPRFMDVSIRVPLDARRDGKNSAAQLVQQILARVKEVREHENALLPGSVYCYFNESATLGSSRPTEPREVFDGYTSTGRPQFTDFVTMAIERKDAGIDEMLSGREMVVTHVSLGRVLRTQQLAEFGKSSPVYRILGQVDAGLYDVVNAPHRAAFSFQLLRGVTLEGKPRLRVHPVSAVDVRDLADPSVAEILRRFQNGLDAESLRLAGKEANGESGDDAEDAFVLPLLQDLAKRLAGRAKRQGRRTEHATQRADESERPTTHASDDAKVAGDDAILWDDTEGTVVVVGPRGRVHVFTPDAKHVTSFRMTGGNIATRRKEGRWRPADPGARGEFRIQFRKRLAGSDAEAAVPVDPTPVPSGPSAPSAQPASDPMVSEQPHGGDGASAEPSSAETSSDAGSNSGSSSDSCAATDPNTPSSESPGVGPPESQPPSVGGDPT